MTVQAAEPRRCQRLVDWGEHVDRGIPPRDHSGMDPASSITPQEYPGWGGPMYTEPALKLALSGEPVSAAGLPGLDAEAALSLVRRLLTAAVLVPEPGA